MLLCASLRPAFAISEEGYKQLHVFSKVLHLVEENYVDQIDDQKVVQGAVRGMLRALDPHSAYMTADVYRELKVDTSGRFDGVGMEVTLRDGLITVIAPIQGSPAEAAGIQPGDQIIRIDGTSTENMDLGKAVNLMRGRRGTKVLLTIRRAGVKQPMEIAVTREKINVPSVKSEEIDSRYGYIAITSFQEDTADSLGKALKKFKKQDALHGLIIDMRRNPGGLLEEAVAVSDAILKSGVIVTTAQRGKEIDRYEATDNGDEPDCPVIVLVDGGSASASEIVAGALQDNRAATLVGTQTFGKGSVQTVFELGDGSAVKITIARYFTPNGTSIQAYGITPDIEVQAKVPEVTEAATKESEKEHKRLREADLGGHLEGSQSQKPPRPQQTLTVKKLIESKIVEKDAPAARDGTIKDYQKQVAIDFLKYLDTPAQQ